MVTTALTVLSSVCHSDMTQIIREYDSFCSLDIEFNLFIKVLDKKFKCFYYETCPSSLCNHYISIFSSSNGIFIFSFFLSFTCRSISSEKKWRQVLLFILFSVKKTKNIESPWWKSCVPPSWPPPAAGLLGVHQLLHACAAAALPSSVWWRWRKCHF